MTKGLDLAVIGNCTVASVIAPHGRHVWFCFPRLDADPVFNALPGGMAPKTGFLRGQRAAEQRYPPNTAVLEMVLGDGEGGQARVIGFCPPFRRHGRISRPSMLLRRIEPVVGRPRVTVSARPSFDHGANAPQRGFGNNHKRFVGPDQMLNRLSARREEGMWHAS